jgi:hypothetical protein
LAESAEVTFWESVRDSKDAAEIEAYLKAYPDGQFAPLARIRLDKLKQTQPQAAPTETTPRSRQRARRAPLQRLLADKASPPSSVAILCSSAAASACGL